MNAFFISPEHWPAKADQELVPPKPVLVEGAEAQHMLKVLRLKPGEQVWCCDGQGNCGVFVIQSTGKHEAWLTPRSLEYRPRPTRGAVLALGWAKSLRRGWLLEKAVEFEAEALWIWQARHSQGKPPAEIKESWRAQCIAGAKQSKNPWLPEFVLQGGGAAGLAGNLDQFASVFLLWEEPGCQRLLTRSDLQSEGRTLFIVGPEGGLAKEEVQLLQQAGARPVSLGRRVLRWETAALLCLGLAWWARQGGAHE